MKITMVYDNAVYQASIERAPHDLLVKMMIQPKTP